MDRLTESSLHNADLGSSSIQSSKRTPIIHHETGTDNFRSSVDGTGDKGHLEQGRELVQLGTRSFRVNETALSR